MATSFRCQICSEPALATFDAYRSLPRVTSDSKPWPAGGELTVCDACGAIQKLPTEQWRSEAARIYENYEMYHLSRGAEQLVFSDGGDIKPRSVRLVDFVIANTALPETGRLIDIGCGNGEAIGNFARALPQWKLYGSELTDKVLARVGNLQNFVHLYTLPPAQIDERFSLVTMIHALEHMPAPLETLTAAAKLIEPGGWLFVEVPDIETSPFDLLVADHMMHFSRASLGLLAARAGMAVSTLVNDVAPKEITLLGRPGQPGAVKPDAQYSVQLVSNTISWLVDVLAEVRALAKEKVIGIFGTSVAAMAFYGALRERVGFFVDEDPARIGKSYDGKPVLSPTQVSPSNVIFVALPPDRAVRVVKRLSATSRGAYVAPPPLPEISVH